MFAFLTSVVVILLQTSEIRTRGGASWSRGEPFQSLYYQVQGGTRR